MATEKDIINFAKNLNSSQRYLIFQKIAKEEKSTLSKIWQWIKDLFLSSSFISYLEDLEEFIKKNDIDPISPQIESLKEDYFYMLKSKSKHDLEYMKKRTNNFHLLIEKYIKNNESKENSFWNNNDRIQSLKELSRKSRDMKDILLNDRGFKELSQ